MTALGFHHSSLYGRGKSTCRFGALGSVGGRCFSVCWHKPRSVQQWEKRKNQVRMMGDKR